MDNKTEEAFQVDQLEFHDAENINNLQAKLFESDHTFEEKYMHYSEYGLKEPIVSDCDQVRVQIPGSQAVNLDSSALIKMFREMIGKDLSRFSLPVFINEPTSILMKSAEFNFYNQFLTDAGSKKDPSERMLYVAAKMIASFTIVPLRTGKPFNPLLGETYELVTPQFRYFSEMVSHHPPIVALSCEGQNYEISRTCETVQQFNGKLVKVYDKNRGSIFLFLDGNKETKEHYSFMEPNMVVGNLFVGTRYVEPQGIGSITCAETGCSAEIDFKERGWLSNEEMENYIEGVIKDKDGVEKYKLSGKYTDSLQVENTQTGEKWEIFKAPEKPANSELMYHMRLDTLQMNVLSDALKKNLPKTDSRYRTDMRAWEQADLELATKEKLRLEQNQKARREQVKEMLKNDPKKQNNSDINDERTFYEPLFFSKTTLQHHGEKTYTYQPKRVNESTDYQYWFLRDKENAWKVPPIFEDGCEPFYDFTKEGEDTNVDVEQRQENTDVIEDFFA